MRRSGMMPYFAAAIAAIAAAAAFTNWAMPRLQADLSGGTDVGSTINFGDNESVIDPNQFLLETDDFSFNLFEEDDSLNSTGFGGSP